MNGGRSAVAFRQPRKDSGEDLDCAETPPQSESVRGPSRSSHYTKAVNPKMIGNYLHILSGIRDIASGSPRTACVHR